MLKKIYLNLSKIYSDGFLDNNHVFKAITRNRWRPTNSREIPSVVRQQKLNHVRELRCLL